MAKIPFDIKYRDKIESGEYKVELRDGRPVKIIYWEAKGPAPIIGLFMADDGSETTTEAHSNGRWCDDEGYVSDYDLFIVIPAGEMTPFEEKLIQFYDERISMESDNFPEDREGEILADHLHRKAAEILSFAREQFIKDGYVIQKKAFHDAVEKVDPEVMKEVSENVDKLSKEELTEFEKRLWEIMKSEGSPIGPLEKFTDDDKRVFRAYSGQLFALARKQLQPEIDAEIAKAYKNADKIVYENGVLYGKAEALKDLPRWRKAKAGTKLPADSVIRRSGEEPRLGCVAIYDCEYITVNDLNRLQKEDEK